MIRIFTADNRLVVHAEHGDLAPRHESQLAFWGFKFDTSKGTFVSPPNEIEPLIQKIAVYLDDAACPYEIEPQTQSLLLEQEAAESALSTALDRGAKLKSGSLDIAETAAFFTFLEDHVPRSLKEHQCKAALHLLAVRNGANFSVPGSGKTSVVLAVFHRLRMLDEVDSLFVVGPPACFGPWRSEFEEVLGNPPSCETLAGGDVDDRRTKYLVNNSSIW